MGDEEGIPRNQVDHPRMESYGHCSINIIQPPVNDPKIFNIYIDFTEALKLKLALADILLQLNKENQTFPLRDIKIQILTDSNSIEVYRGESQQA